MTERDRRHPAWGDLSLSGVQTLARLQSAREAPSQGSLSGSTCGCAEHRALGWQLTLTPYQGSQNWGGPAAQVCALTEPGTATSSCRGGAGLAALQASGFLPGQGQEWGSAGQSPWHPF